VEESDILSDVTNTTSKSNAGFSLDIGSYNNYSIKIITAKFEYNAFQFTACKKPST